MRGISIKAILLATLAVVGIDFLTGAVLIGVFAEPLVDPTDAEVKAAMEALNRNQGYLVAALILGTASTVVGGYLVARLAGVVPYFNALAFAAFGMLLGSLISTETPTWFTVVALGVTIPAALLGAHLSKRAGPAQRS